MNNDKPFVLTFLETKQTIVDTINNAVASGIPFVIIDAILSDISKQVTQAAIKEKDTALELYNKSKTADVAKEQEETTDE